MSDANMTDAPTQVPANQGNTAPAYIPSFWFPSSPQLPPPSGALHQVMADVAVLKASAEADARQALKRAVASAEQAACDAEQAVHDRADELKAHVENTMRAAAVRVEGVLAGRASHLATAVVAALAGSGLLAWGLLAFLGAKALGL